MDCVAISCFVICTVIVNIAPATGLKCYTCLTVESPTTCDVGNFDPSAHAMSTTTTVLHAPDTGKPCMYCTKGYYLNPVTGVYSYARGCENSYRATGCLRESCACDSDLCNNAVTMATTRTTFTVLTLCAVVINLIN